MNDFIKVSATAISCSIDGTNSKNSNFYLDGKYLFGHERYYVQKSIDYSRNSHLFAVYENMGKGNTDEKDKVSICKELNKTQETMENDDSELDMKAIQLSDTIQLASNLIYSKPSNLGEHFETSFSGMMLLKDRAVVINLGSSGVFLLRDDILQNITSNGRKPRVFESSEEQGGENPRHMPIMEDELKVKTFNGIRIKKNDIFLICNEGVIANLDTWKIQTIIAAAEDISMAADAILKEAMKNSPQDNLVVCVIKIDEASGSNNSTPIVSSPVRKRTRVQSQKPQRNENLPTYIAAIITSVVIVGVIILAYFMWFNNGDTVKEVAVDETTSVSPTPQSTDSNSASGDETNDLDSLPNVDDQSGGQVKISPAPTKTPANNTSKNDEVMRYTVQRGDSLEVISKKVYGDSRKYKVIMEYNNIKNPNSIRIGQVLLIPKNPDSKPSLP